MIFLKAQGRLGNQLFQYSFAKYINKVTNGNGIKIDFDRVRKNSKEKGDGWDNSLTDVGIKDFTEIYYSQIKYLPVWIKLKLIRSILAKKSPSKRCGEKDGVILCYDPIEQHFKLKNQNYILDGLFEYNYVVDEVLNDIRNQIIDVQSLEESKKKLYSELEKKEVVCVSIRKFDLEDPKFSHFYQVCSKKYYINAIESISKEVGHPVNLFVCSDAIQWCKDNMQFENMNCVNEAIYEKEKNSLRDKLILMSASKYFVISNSTFSWWAQKLSVNKANGIVCAPYMWNAKYRTQDMGLYDSSWKLIQN